ncbi:MAG: AAA family ATPase [Nitrospinota bacterium]
MQLREIHIDGFGIFCNKRVTGLKPGLNIIYGKNEFGKTTLLEFIRRILFGFPTKKEKSNLYQPVNGGSMGGSLKVELKNGEGLVISRTPGTHGGDVRISTPQEVLRGQDVLNHVLGNASKDIYRNIYAFTLDELHDFNSLSGDEVKNRIYGAGLGLGNLSLKNIEKDLENMCTQIFRPRGACQLSDLLEKIKVNEQAIQSIQKNLTLYDELQGQHKKLIETKTAVQNSLQDLESEKRILESQIHLYEDAVLYMEAKDKLESMDDYSSFPKNALNSFKSLAQGKESLEERLEEEKESLNSLKSALESLKINHELLKNEESINRLQQSTQSIHSALQDAAKVQIEREDLDMEISSEIKSIDRNWDEDTLLEFDLTEAEKDQIDQFFEEFESLRKEQDLFLDRLESHRRIKAEEASKGWNIPHWLKQFHYGFTGAGIAGVILGGYLGNYPLLGAAVVIVGGGIFLFKKIIEEKNSFSREDMAEKNLAHQYEKKKQELDQKFDEWRKWLKQRKLDPGIAPITTKNIGKTARQIKSMISQRGRLDERIEQMRETLKEAENRISSLTSLVETVSPDNEILANIETLCQAFAESKVNNERRELLEIQQKERDEKISRLEAQLKTNAKEIENFVHSVGATDIETFHVKQAGFESYQDLKKTVEQKKGNIHSNVGLGQHFDQFLDDIRSTPLEEIKQNLGKKLTNYSDLQETREQLLQDIGETRNELEKLAANNDLVERQNELESQKQELKSLAETWASYRSALVLIEEAKKRYEKTRQPGVIRAAENLFSEITSGAYDHIIKPIDSDDILIENDRHKRKGVQEMSRGTLEQLYLAMRFGLIEEYESRSEPLPAVLDDVFVNFDDERDQKLIEVLNQFGKQRQVIVLTCHQRSLEAYKGIGANQITV